MPKLLALDLLTVCVVGAVLLFVGGYTATGAVAHGLTLRSSRSALTNMRSNAPPATSATAP